MPENADHPDDQESGSPEDDRGAINDPLTQRDVAAPRTEFEGRKPE